MSGTIFAYIAFDVIEEHGGIKDFRVVQKEPDLLEITLVRDANFTERILGYFTSKIRELLGSEMRVDYIFKEEIPLEGSGKRLYVCSELPESHDA